MKDVEQVLKAINNWIANEDNLKVKYVDITTIPTLYNEMINPGEIRDDAIRYFFDKSEVTRHFFDAIIIDGEIDFNREPVFRDAGFVGTYEGIFIELKFKNNTLEDNIDKYYSRNLIFADLDSTVKSRLHGVRRWRNKIHPDKNTGKRTTDEEWRKAWTAYVIGILIIAYIEYKKKLKEEQIMNPLKEWYKKNNQSVLNVIYDKFKEYYLKDDLYINHVNNIIFRNITLYKSLAEIYNLLDERQCLVSTEGLPDLVSFIKLFVFEANGYIYKNAYNSINCNDDEIQSLDNGIDLLGKLCIQTCYKNEEIVVEVRSCCNEIANMANKDNNIQIFNTHFFRALFLIAALKQAVSMASTGACYYTETKRVRINRNGKDNNYDELREKESLFQIAYDPKTRDGDKPLRPIIEWKGDNKHNLEIQLEKKKWSIVLIYISPDGQLQKRIKKVDFPGLEDLNKLWKEFLQVPETEDGDGDGNGGNTGVDGGNPPIPTPPPLQQNKQAFNDYKEKIKSGLYDDFGVFIDHVNELVKAIDGLSYDENKGLDGNKTAVDTEEKKIRIELVNLRNQSFQERNQKDFEKCKEEYIKKIQKLSESNGNYYELIAKAQKEIEEQQYDDLKDFSSNEIALKNILEELNFNLHEREAFEKEKQSLLSELEQLDCKSKKGAFLKANAKERITDLRYDEFRADKVALMNIMVQLKKDLAKIGFLDISIEKTIIITQWIDKNWKWCALALCTIVLAIVLFVVFDGDDRVRIPIDEAVPSLESKSWRISEMDSKSVFGSAEVSSVDGSNTHYSLRHITETGKEIIVTFNVDWQTGTAMSPELGEGKIEKDSKLNTIKIIFEEWTISRYY